jgi:diguanylate cyclase (GGDEF)-like protein
MANDARILLIEPQKTARENLFETLVSLGYDVVVATDREEAIEHVDAFAPQVVLSSHVAMDADLVDDLREVVEVQAAVVVIFPRGTKNPDRRAAELGAAGGFCRPVARDTFALVLRLAEAVAQARRETAALQRRNHELGEKLERIGDVRPGQRFYHFEFFKHLLLVEIRRAKRYKYPLSVCLVELDPYRLPPGQLMARREIRASVARAVSESIRDIDIPVYVGGERILIVLPHTPHQGAKKVARRVSRLIREGMYPVGEDAQPITASIGVSGLDQGRQLSFAQLIREAQKALDSARKKGGDTVVTRN